MKDYVQGMLHTVWSDAASFLKEGDAIKGGKKVTGLSQWMGFDKMFQRINELAVIK